MAFDHGNAFQTFQKVCECLNKNFTKKYFLIDGTLLGFVRNGGFITNDYDIDIGMWIEDLSPQILEDFKKAGFVFKKTLGTISSGLQYKFRYNNVRVDLVFYYREKDSIWNMVFPSLARYRAVYPLFDLKAVEFCGVKVMAPSPPEVYLEAVYGPDWRRPIQRWNYKYLCHNLESLNGPVINGIYWLREKIWRWKNPDPYLKMDGSRQKIVLTDGVFDLFHANHALLLKEARSRGDLLVAAVISDRLAATYKRTPIIPQDERLQIVQSQKSVDIAFILDGPFDAKAMNKVIADYHIDTVVYAGDSTGVFYDFYSPAIEGGFFESLPYHQGPTTSEIISRLKE